MILQQLVLDHIYIYIHVVTINNCGLTYNNREMSWIKFTLVSIEMPSLLFLQIKSKSVGDVLQTLHSGRQMI